MALYGGYDWTKGKARCVTSQIYFRHLCPWYRNDGCCETYTVRTCGNGSAKSRFLSLFPSSTTTRLRRCNETADDLSLAMPLDDRHVRGRCWDNGQKVPPILSFVVDATWISATRNTRARSADPPDNPSSYDDRMRDHCARSTNSFVDWDIVSE